MAALTLLSGIKESNCLYNSIIVLTKMRQYLVYHCESPGFWFTMDDLVSQRNMAYPGPNKPLRAERNMTGVSKYFKPTF